MHASGAPVLSQLMLRDEAFLSSLSFCGLWPCWVPLSPRTASGQQQAAGVQEPDFNLSV